MSQCVSCSLAWGFCTTWTAKHLNTRYDMAYSASGHEEANGAFWLANRALGILDFVPEKQIFFCHIINPNLFEIGLVHLFTSTSFNSRSIKTPKKKLVQYRAILTSHWVNNAYIHLITAGTYVFVCMSFCKLQDMLAYVTQLYKQNTLGQQSVPPFFVAFFSCCLQVMKGPPRSPWTKITSASILDLKVKNKNLAFPQNTFYLICITF